MSNKDSWQFPYLSRAVSADNGGARVAISLSNVSRCIGPCPIAGGSQNASSASGSAIVATLVAVIIVVLIVAAVLAFVLYKRRRRSEENVIRPSVPPASKRPRFSVLPAEELGDADDTLPINPLTPVSQQMSPSRITFSPVTANMIVEPQRSAPPTGGSSPRTSALSQGGSLQARSLTNNQPIHSLSTQQRSSGGVSLPSRTSATMSSAHLRGSTHGDSSRKPTSIVVSEAARLGSVVANVTGPAGVGVLPVSQQLAPPLLPTALPAGGAGEGVVVSYSRTSATSRSSQQRSSDIVQRQTSVTATAPLATLPRESIRNAPEPEHPPRIGETMEEPETIQVQHALDPLTPQSAAVRDELQATPFGLKVKDSKGKSKKKRIFAPIESWGADAAPSEEVLDPSEAKETTVSSDMPASTFSTHSPEHAEFNPDDSPTDAPKKKKKKAKDALTADAEPALEGAEMSPDDSPSDAPKKKKKKAKDAPTADAEPALEGAEMSPDDEPLPDDPIRTVAKKTKARRKRLAHNIGRQLDDQPAEDLAMVDL